MQHTKNGDKIAIFSMPQKREECSRFCANRQFGCINPSKGHNNLRQKSIPLLRALRQPLQELNLTGNAVAHLN